MGRAADAPSPIRMTRAANLSEREMDVLKAMATGGANKEIAAALTLSESTVKTHVANIFVKLEVNDRTGAVTEALRRKIISI